MEITAALNRIEELEEVVKQKDKMIRELLDIAIHNDQTIKTVVSLLKKYKTFEAE